jgi:hypothetical protein
MFSSNNLLRHLVLSVSFFGFIGMLFFSEANASNSWQKSDDRMYAIIMLHSEFDPERDTLPPGVSFMRGLLPNGWEVDIFLGVDVDAVAIFGFEYGFGIVVDLDTPFDSGIYGTWGWGGGCNVGAGVLGGVVIGGNLEGQACVIDLDLPFGVGPLGAHSQFGVGDDGGVILGGGVGVGGGASSTASSTSTFSVQHVIDFLTWLIWG